MIRAILRACSLVLLAGATFFIPLSSNIALAETVRFETQDGIVLAADYIGPAEPRGGVVLHHGLGSVGGEWTAFAQYLAQSGYGVLLYDARGHGNSTQKKSGGKVDFHYFFGRGPKSEWGMMVQDMGAAIDFLSGMRGIDPKKIGVMGASIGANIAFRCAASRPEVPWAVMLSPGMDYQGITVSDLLPGYIKSKRRLFIAASKADRYAYQSAAAMKDVTSYLGAGAQTSFVIGRQGHGVQMFARKNPKEPSELEVKILKWIEGRK